MTDAQPKVQSQTQDMAGQIASAHSLKSLPEGLKSALVRSISGRCDFSDAGIALYTSDASNYRQVPHGVVFPKSIDDVVAAVSVCREYSVPVLMRGGGTSQNGQTVNNAIIIDCSQHLNRVLSIDVDAKTALVEPGIVCDALKAEAEEHGLTWGPDPATHSRCTLGGMIGNNSCGPHSMLAGKTVENVIELEVLTPTGERFWVGPTSDIELEAIIAGNDQRADIYRNLKALRDEYADLIRQKYPDIKRRVSGYNLDQLLPENGFNVARALVGSEGTCVSILQAKLNLIDNPEYKQLIVLGFDDIFIAGDSVPEIMPFSPIAMEGLDWAIVGGLIDRQLRLNEVALLPDGKAWLLVELADNNTETLARRCREFQTAMEGSARVKSVLPVNDPAMVKDFWTIREQGASATSMSLRPEDPDPIVGWEDTAVDPLQLGDYLREFSALVKRYGYTTSLYGHFGDGCIHARITFDTRTEAGVKKFRAFSREIAETVVRFGGSLSGEHGDGQAKAEFLPIMFGDELITAFDRFKAAWDPELRMNPRKVVNPYRVDENLRLGPDYQPAPVNTTLKFHEDIGGFSRTTERCIGMGKCRAATGAMCPSYQATGEERYSTRGRAHLLHELIRGELIKEGFSNKDIADSLEHCLSCKACKSECPTQVDIASYKSEFMAKHYQQNKRPYNHYFLAHIGTLLPRAAKYSGPANFFQKGIFGSAVRKFLDIHPQKDLPAISKEPFTTAVAKESTSTDDHFYYIGDQSQPTVVLWADTVNNHYRPHLLHSAIAIAKTCGYSIAVAKSHFCCGRPLYEYGYLDQAKQQLQQILDNFQDNLPESAPVIVLEPSCLSVFKDELLRMYPDDDRATDLSSRATTVTAWLSTLDTLAVTPFKHGILHLHCHDKAITNGASDRQWMNQCFENVTEPESGCCGMAGTFGIKNKTHHIGQKLFNRALAPAIQAATNDTIVVSNGFSCAEAIRDNTTQKALHPLEVIEQCLIKKPRQTKRGSD